MYAHIDIYSHIGHTRKTPFVLYQGDSREAMVNFSISQLEVNLKLASGNFS